MFDVSPSHGIERRDSAQLTSSDTVITSRIPGENLDGDPVRDECEVSSYDDVKD